MHLRIVVACLAAAGFAACIIPALVTADTGAVPIFVTQVPPGYRDWRLVSVSHEAANFNSIGAVLGNDLAMQAFRSGTLPYPDGAIIAALHYRHAPSEENDKVFGKPQSFVAGAPTNIQFMVKDSKKYAATGGWGFGHFDPSGKPGDAAFMKACFPCHEQIQDRDLVFTRYAP
jgi:Cytochrome P460